MDLVEVDVVGAQPGQAGVDLVQDRLAGQARAVRPRAHPAVHLGREHDVLARGEVAQRAAGDLLAAAAGVDVGGVEDVDPRVERVLDDRATGGLVEDPRVAAAAGSPQLMHPSVTTETSSPVLPSLR